MTNPGPGTSHFGCVILLSGGLDSTLAARVLLEQGLRVTGVNFVGAYCPAPFGTESNAEKAARVLGVELVRLPIDEGFIEIVKAPRYGRGRNMNPCIDCHILMVKRAWQYGRERGADFVATGEVLGQRPMSQNKQALGLVARRSEAEGHLLRPLSAKLLEATVPETRGLVDRARLLDIQGRTRQRQMELARQYAINDYPAPAGGCLLTDAGYSARLREALAHGEDSPAALELLSLGRHFRLASGAKVIVGRNESENEELLRRAPAGSLVADGRLLPGPVALLAGPHTAPDALLAARLCARYSDRKKEASVSLTLDGNTTSVVPASPEESAALAIG